MSIVIVIGPQWDEIDGKRIFLTWPKNEGEIIQYGKYYLKWHNSVYGRTNSRYYYRSRRYYEEYISIDYIFNDRGIWKFR